MWVKSVIAGKDRYIRKQIVIAGKQIVIAGKRLLSQVKLVMAGTVPRRQ
jgi:hypothetical protein